VLYNNLINGAHTTMIRTIHKPKRFLKLVSCVLIFVFMFRERNKSQKKKKKVKLIKNEKKYFSFTNLRLLSPHQLSYLYSTTGFSIAMVLCALVVVESSDVEHESLLTQVLKHSRQILAIVESIV